MERARGNEYKLHWKGCHPDIIYFHKKFFTVRTVRCWNNLPTEVVPQRSFPGYFQGAFGQNARF